MGGDAELEEQIEVLIRARYPIIYLVSYEEDRVFEMIRRIANRRQKQVIAWSVTEGLVPVDTSARDPQRALAAVLKDKGDRSAIYVFKDLHVFLNDPVVVRQLRDLASYLKSTLKTVVMVSPVLKLVPELEKDVTVVDIPLPDTQKLNQILDDILNSVDSAIKNRIEPARREQLVKAALGLTSNEAQNVFAECLVRYGDIHLDTVVRAKEQIIRKSGILEFYSNTEEFGSVGGLEPLKDWLMKRRHAFSDKAKAFGLPAPRGVLLFGVQGCGKSLVAKSIASIWEVPLLRLDVGKLFGGVVGSSEDNIRRAIALAESVAPCVLWVDEIEKAFAGTRSSDMSDAGTTARVFGTFLTWLQEKEKPVFVVATSNDISSLPPELLRKGRFDEIFFVDLPSRREREEIFAIHLRKRGKDPAKYDLSLLADETLGFSGAEIEQVIVDALFAAFEEDRELTMDDLLVAVKRTVPLSTTMRESLTSLREFARTRAVRASQEESDYTDTSRRIEF